MIKTMPEQVIMKCDRCKREVKDGFACEVTMEFSERDLSGKALMAFNVGKEIHEKLNTKKKVDYSVLRKHHIDCIDGYDGKIVDGDEASYIKSPRTNHWFSALNFDDVEQVVNDLREAGFDVTAYRDSTTVILMAFKINGKAEGYEL